MKIPSIIKNLSSSKITFQSENFAGNNKHRNSNRIINHSYNIYSQSTKNNTNSVNVSSYNVHDHFINNNNNSISLNINQKALFSSKQQKTNIINPLINKIQTLKLSIENTDPNIIHLNSERNENNSKIKKIKFSLPFMDKKDDLQSSDRNVLNNSSLGENNTTDYINNSLTFNEIKDNPTKGVSNNSEVKYNNNYNPNIVNGRKSNFMRGLSHVVDNLYGNSDFNSNKNNINNLNDSINHEPGNLDLLDKERQIDENRSIPNSKKAINLFLTKIDENYTSNKTKFSRFITNTANRHDKTNEQEINTKNSKQKIIYDLPSTKNQNSRISNLSFLNLNLNSPINSLKFGYVQTENNINDANHQRIYDEHNNHIGIWDCKKNHPYKIFSHPNELSAIHKKQNSLFSNNQINENYDAESETSLRKTKNNVYCIRNHNSQGQNGSPILDNCYKNNFNENYMNHYSRNHNKSSFDVLNLMNDKPLDNKYPNQKNENRASFILENSHNREEEFTNYYDFKRNDINGSSAFLSEKNGSSKLNLNINNVFYMKEKETNEGILFPYSNVNSPSSNYEGSRFLNLNSENSGSGRSRKQSSKSKQFLQNFFMKCQNEENKVKSVIKDLNNDWLNSPIKRNELTNTQILLNMNKSIDKFLFSLDNDKEIKRDKMLLLLGSQSKEGKKKYYFENKESSLFISDLISSLNSDFILKCGHVFDKYLVKKKPENSLNLKSAAEIAEEKQIQMRMEIKHKEVKKILNNMEHSKNMSIKIVNNVVGNSPR